MVDWNPILDLEEPEPGVWVMRDTMGSKYAEITLRRVSDGLRYRCVFRGALIGWASSLRTAVDKTYQEFIRSHGPQGAAYTSPDPIR